MIHSNINKVLTLPPLESHGTYKKKHEDTTGYICKMHIKGIQGLRDKGF